MGRNSNAAKETLPSLHRKKMDEIDSVEAALPEMKERLEGLKTSLQKETNPTKKRDVELEINDLEKEIDKASKARSQYLLQNGELLYKFTECSKKKARVYTLADLGRKRGIGDKETSEKFKYYTRYRSNVDPEYVHSPESNVNEENYCYDCRCFRVLHTEDAIMVCEKCGSQITVSTLPEKPSLKDPPTESHYYEYKRFTHFCYWLDNLQGKERNVVPDEVINTVIREIKRVRMEDRLDELNEEDIKGFLKKHSSKGYDKYYDHATQILFRITDIQPVQMTQEMEHNLKVMFVEIQEPFEIYKVNGRRNFSSYAYVIYKFCQLLGYDEFLPKLKLHKDYQKLYEHDMIWKKICKHMGGEEKGWKFIKSYEY